VSRGFPFLSSLYGSYGLTFPAQPLTVKRVSDGSVYLTTTLGRDTFASYRSGKTSNAPHMLSLFGPRWRDQSSYSRSGFRNEAIISGNYKLSPSKALFVEGNYLDWSMVRSNAVAYDKSNPHFYPGEVHLVRYSNDEVENSRIAAIEHALSDLASSKASMGENLAQLSQTVDLFATIADATVDIFRAYKALRRGDLKRLADLTARDLKRLVKDRKVEKRVANYWLAYWYGFKPLVSDAYGLWELMKEQAKPVLLVHGRGRSSVSHGGSFKSPSVSALSCGLNFTDSSSVIHQTQLTGKLDDARLLRTINRAGLANVPALLWELIPFSFVIDWGVPVGTFLSNLSASSGLTFLDGSSSVTFERELLATVDAPWQIGNSNPTTHMWGFGTTRTKLSSFPSGGIYSKPFFTGASRFAVIGALLSNLTRGS